MASSSGTRLQAGLSCGSTRRILTLSRFFHHLQDTTLAAVDDDTPLHLLLDRVSRRVTYHGRPVRALRIGDPGDLALLAAVARGEFATAGFRNRDLRGLLYCAQPDSSSLQQRRLSARVSRQLRMLRAHRLIRKIPRSHRYRLTQRGHLLAAALFAARQSTISKLIGSAAA